MRFYESQTHHPEGDAELFVVEGDSAAEAVHSVRNSRLQAVLALQGKPMNAMRATPAKLMGSPWLAALTDLLGTAPGTALPLGELRYRRVLLVMDPDADGIHAAALMQIFFYRCMPALLDAGQIAIVHAPWGEIRRPGHPSQLSFHAAEYQQQCRALVGVAGVERIRHRGLGTITPQVLAQTCVDPATRRASTLSLADAAMAVAVFGA
jgi:DNA gyrase subunit B